MRPGRWYPITGPLPTAPSASGSAALFAASPPGSGTAVSIRALVFGQRGRSDAGLLPAWPEDRGRPAAPRGSVCAAPDVRHVQPQGRHGTPLPPTGTLHSTAYARAFDWVACRRPASTIYCRTVRLWHKLSYRATAGRYGLPERGDRAPHAGDVDTPGRELRVFWGTQASAFLHAGIAEDADALSASAWAGACACAPDIPRYCTGTTRTRSSRAASARNLALPLSALARAGSRHPPGPGRLRAG